MRRKLLGKAPRVKRSAAIAAALCPLWCAIGACGSAGAPPPPKDPYGPRVQNCIEAPRGESDAAHARMIALPAGAARIGSSSSERAQAARDFGPGGAAEFQGEPDPERVQLPAFRLDKSPVTNAQYAEFIAACGVPAPDGEAISLERWATLRREFSLPHDYAQVEQFLWPGPEPDRGRLAHPVVLVDWDSAAFYCAWRGGRLPTAQEWERGARGVQGSDYPWGSAFDAARANTAARGAGDTLAVGSLPEGNTPEGFTDMGGNVLEWTSSAWPGRAGAVVTKGNAWDGRAGYGRGASRVAMPKKAMDVVVGFRCAAN